MESPTLLRETYLCDHGEPDEVGRDADDEDEEFFTRTQVPRPLVDARRDEALHRAELQVSIEKTDHIYFNGCSKKEYAGKHPLCFTGGSRFVRNGQSEFPFDSKSPFSHLYIIKTNPPVQYKIQRNFTWWRHISFSDKAGPTCVRTLVKTLMNYIGN